MEIWDYDTFSNSDLIDIHSYSKSLTPGVNGSGSIIAGNTLGWRDNYKTRLSFTLEVNCLPNYYGSSCNKSCKAQDDTHGHYNCDRNGDRSCLNGWYLLPGCLRHCVARNDSINGHYVCDSQGGHVCRKDWFNAPNCLTNCVSYDDDVNGHFTCNSTGSRVCRANWYNLPNCTKHCTGDINVSCNSTGDRVCHTGWYGVNCTVRCVPRSDTQGHYNCSDQGQKLCHQDWHGSNCMKHCKARNDSLGHFNCSDNGAEICHRDYYGKNCTLFCIAPDTRFKCDQNTGKKICGGYWIGPFCNSSTSIFITPSYSTSFSELSTSISDIHLPSLKTSVILPTLFSSSFLVSTKHSSSMDPRSKSYYSTSEKGADITRRETAAKTTSNFISSSYFSSSSRVFSRTHAAIESSVLSAFITSRFVSPSHGLASASSTFTIHQEKASYATSTPVETLSSIATSTLKHSSNVKPSKSSSLSPVTKTSSAETDLNPTALASTEANLSTLEWLFKTKDGKFVLGASGLVLFLFIALAVAVAMYIR